MAQTRIEIYDDPNRPEGGHALLVWHGLAEVPTQDFLCFDPIDEALGADAIKVAAQAQQTEIGVAFALGPEVVDRLQSGIGVSIALERAGIASEVLWPSLTPSAATRPASKGRLGAAARKRVVASPAPVVDRPVPVAPVVPPPPPTSPAPQQPAPPAPKPAPPPPSPPSSPVAAAAALAKITSPPPSQGGLSRVKDPKPSGGINPALAAGMAVLCLLAGGAGGWFLRGPGERVEPPPLPPPPAPIVRLLPPVSPYDFLVPLATMSPGGRQVAMQERKDFLSRGLSSINNDPAEGEFWLKWAMLSTLSRGELDVPAIVSSFAFVVAKAKTSDANRLSARFLWELAAAGGDCSAMRNLSIAIGGPEMVARERQEADKWRERARVKGCT